MAALASHGDLPERGERALRAGCDGLLFCRRLEAAPAIAARLGRPAVGDRRQEAEARLAGLRRRLARLRRAAAPPPAPERVRRALAEVTAASAAEP